MGVRGWVYILTNVSMPGLVKVGYSTKDPGLRAEELNHTGVPTPYVVVYDVLVVEPRTVEKCVHESLEDHHAGKEWFKCEIQVAVRAIRAVAGDGLILESRRGVGDLDQGIATMKPESDGGRLGPTKKKASVEEYLTATAYKGGPSASTFKERSLEGQQAWRSDQAVRGVHAQFRCWKCGQALNDPQGRCPSCGAGGPLAKARG
jgi:hypothetical protein